MGNFTIRVFLFQDRMEVISPGRLPNTVIIEKLPVGTSYARNPVLVRFMENIGYVDKIGRGLPMVCREVIEKPCRIILKRGLSPILPILI